MPLNCNICINFVFLQFLKLVNLVFINLEKYWKQLKGGGNKEGQGKIIKSK